MLIKYNCSRLHKYVKHMVFCANFFQLVSARFNLSEPDNNSKYISILVCQFYLRSETLGSSGISNPPRSRIEVEGIDYSKHLDGFNIVVVDLKTGIVESSVNFRVDIDPNAGKSMADYLGRVSGRS